MNCVRVKSSYMLETLSILNYESVKMSGADNQQGRPSGTLNDYMLDNLMIEDIVWPL